MSTSTQATISKAMQISSISSQGEMPPSPLTAMSGVGVGASVSAALASRDAAGEAVSGSPTSMVTGVVMRCTVLPSESVPSTEKKYSPVSFTCTAMGRTWSPLGRAEIVSTTSPARSVTVTPEIVPTPALRSTRLNVTSPGASRCGVFAVTETCRSSAVAVAPTPSTSTRTALDCFS